MFFQSTRRPSSAFNLIYSSIESSIIIAVFILVVATVVVTSANEENGNRVSYRTEWLQTVEEEVTSYPCSDGDSFLCFPEVEKADGMQECVPANTECDGVVDCSNGWDESVQKCGCLETEFQCNATTCIDKLLRCDGKDDCHGGKDEMDCELYTCPLTHTKCNNHLCIPRDRVCNFVDDCGDGSDETICERPKCYPTEMRCKNSQCVTMAQICDGVQDCVDGTDEEQEECDKHMKCPIGIYVSNNVTCDGWVDCHFTHADELNCGKCAINQYTCSNGQCVNQGNVCDGVCDCLGCDDEDECETYACIEEERFLCRPSSTSLGRCIDKNRLCDRVNDCKNSNVGMDEFYCSPDKNCSSHRSSNFSCKEGRCLPQGRKCDGFVDCRDGEDEDMCPEKPSCSETQFPCSSGQCIDLNKRCDSQFDCNDRSDEANCETYGCGSSRVRCLSGQCIASHKWCDWSRDCLDGSDERACNRPQCKDGEFRCDSGQCIDAAYMCYNGNEFAHLGCEDKSHLFNCSSHECGVDQFKCREGYCIDAIQECDVNVDCKFTKWDESNCMYRCPAQSKQCVCHGDEMNCDLKNLTSIPALHPRESLSRLLFARNRLEINQNSFSPSYFGKVTYLDLSNNSISDIPEFGFESMWRLSLLTLSDNNIHRLDPGTFKGLTSLKTLHVSGNRISSIHLDAFLPLINLRALDLSGQRLARLETNVFKGLKRVLTLNLADNQIKTISTSAFNGLCDLLLLNLSRNDIRYLDYGVFLGLRSLQTLDLSSNKLVVISGRLFNGMTQMRLLDISKNQIRHLGNEIFLPMERLETLITDHYKFCCLAGPYVQCTPEADEFSSCEDLMSNHVLRICIWVLGVIALLGNLVVIIWRLQDFRGGRVHSFLITNLAIGDLLMGVYMMIIAGVDMYYRGGYIIHDEEWRQSGLCRFAGFVSTFSSELSVLTLTTITLDRLLCILFPLRRTRLSLKQAIVVMALIWAFVFLIAITPLFGFSYFQDFYGRSGVCLALHITPDRPTGWEYSVAVFLVLNFTSFLVIAASYFWMFVVVRKTRKAVRTSESPNDTAMARRMTVIVMTDFCCWLPIILLGFVSLAGARTDNQVYAWIAVFVLPLNSATNPILYTLSTAPFLGNVRKRVTVFRKSFINSIQADTKHSYVEDRTTHYYYDKKSPYRQLELIRLRSMNNSTTSGGCYSRDNFIDT